MVKGHRWFVIACLMLWTMAFNGAVALTFEQLEHDELRSGISGFAEDRHGMIWLVGLKHLYQYDGVQLHKFMTFDSPTEATSVEMIFVGDRWLYLVGYRGVRKIDLFNRQLEILQPPRSWLGQNSTDYFYGAGFDGYSYLWLLSSKGLVSRINTKTLEWEKVALPTSNLRCQLSMHTYSQMVMHSDGVMWLSNCFGLFMIEPGAETLKDANHLLPSGRTVRRFVTSSGGQLLMGLDERLYRWSDVDSRFEAIECHVEQQHSQIHIEHALYVNAQRLFIGSNQGVIDCNPKTGQAELYRHQTGVRNSLADDWILQLSLGQDGSLWVLSNLALHKVNLFSPEVKHLKHISGKPNSLSSPRVYSVLEARNGIVWLGTANGLNRYDPRTGQFRHYLPDPQVPDSVIAGRIWAMAEDEQGRLYLATELGVNLFDPVTGKSVNRSSNPDWPLAAVAERVWQILLEPTQIWIGTKYQGLYRYDRITGQLQQFMHDPQRADSLLDNWVRKLLRHPDGQLWVGTQAGLTRFDEDLQRFEHFEQPDIKMPTIIDMDVLPNGDLLVSADFVSRLKKGTTELALLQGGKKIYFGTMLLDGKGRLWSSDIDLNFVARDINDLANPASDRLLRGWQSRGLYTNSGDVGASGTLYFGGIDGMFMIEPSLPEPTDFSPPLLFTRVEAERSGQFSYPVLQATNEAIELVPGETRFAIHFAALEYTHSKGIQYQYRLKDFEMDYKSGDRQAEYTNIGPGQYLFEVRYTNSDGVWQQETATLPITLLPYFWQTWWFKVLVLILAVLAMVAWVKWRTRQLIRRAQVLEDEVEARTREISALLSAKEKLIANVSHEFRTPLTLIQGPLDLIVDKARDPAVGRSVQMIRRNSQRLLRMVEHLLQFSKPLEDKADLAPLPADARVQLMIEPFRPLAAKGGLTVNERPAAPDAWIKVPQEPLEKIVTNLLTNAVKYNRKGGNITISTAVIDDAWQLQVSDSGIGIDEVDLQSIFERFSRARQNHHETISGAGLGLALVKELVEGYDGTITVSSELGKGSCFTVTFPLCEAPEQGDLAHQANQSHIALELGDARPIVEPVATVQTDSFGQQNHDFGG